MAFSVVETRIVNPAKKGRNMAKRKMSAKQIRFFGTKRQRAALKAKRSKPKHHAVKHRSAPKRSNPPRRKPSFRKHRKRNPVPEIISLSLGNPARKKGHKTMAKTRHFHKKRAARRSNAGRPRKSVKRYNFSRRKRNPAGLGRPMDWVKGGVSVLGGVVVTRALPQAVAATYNTGGVGYAMNAGVAIAAAWAAHAFLKDPVITSGVAAGGFAALIARMISDMTSFGSYLSLTGMGDYQFSNFVTPQRITAMKNAQVNVPTGWNGTPLPALTTSLYGDEGRGSHC